ncbi:MAG TPA: hypothetical protein PLI09_05755 [Candidatus Hydrogenedentes bacterium]|nr:hypothetical protein [Candidatus Hydrogenedentota bacterium]
MVLTWAGCGWYSFPIGWLRGIPERFDKWERRLLTMRRFAKCGIASLVGAASREESRSIGGELAFSADVFVFPGAFASCDAWKTASGVKWFGA